MSDELGKKYPCFGEFICPRCHKKWQSSKAWADYGQKCKHCRINVISSNLQRLFVYICDNCRAKWKWAYVAEGLECDKCKSSTLVRPLDQRNYQDREFIRAHRLEDLDYAGDENHIDPAKEHRQDLCEKCLRLGRPCRETAGKESRQITDWVPQSTTSLSTSYRASRTVPQSATSSSVSYQSSSTLSPPVDRSDSSTGMTITSIVAIVVGSLLYRFFGR